MRIIHHSATSLLTLLLLSACGGESPDPIPTGTDTTASTPTTPPAGGTATATTTSGATNTTTATGATTPFEERGCQDQVSQTLTINQAFGKAVLETAEGKQYRLITNWWKVFKGQTVTYDGLSLTVTNDQEASSTGAPTGFPALFVGHYDNFTTAGSNLPLPIANIQAIPTHLGNGSTRGYTGYNVTYDVWFSGDGSLITGSDPGPQGALLMVWLFDPTDQRPRGSLAAQDIEVPGVTGRWDMWEDDSQSRSPCVSYVSRTPLADLDFDLNKFIQHAAADGTVVTPSMSLNIVFGGTELWNGAGDVVVQDFCVDVQPK